MHLRIPMYPAYTKLHLVFQPFVKFPDSRNSAFKALLEGPAVVNARSGHDIHHIVFTNVCCLVLVFGGYLGGAGIVRSCVSRMRVGCSQKGSVQFLFTWRKNYGLNSLY